MAKVYIAGSVKNVRALYGNHLKKVTQKVKIESWIKETVELLWEGYKIANPSVAVELTNFHPSLIGASTEMVFATSIAYSDIEDVILEQYGYVTWDDIKAAGNFDTTYEQAVNVALSGDLDAMKRILERHPNIVSESSAFGHKASILQYLAANGVEVWRQYISENIVEMLDMLIEYGANPDAENNIYGGSTLRSLIETSDHTFKSGKADQMLDILKVYGY